MRYYILPQDTHMGRQPHHAAREVFLGKQVQNSCGLLYQIAGCCAACTYLLRHIAYHHSACSCNPTKATEPLWLPRATLKTAGRCGTHSASPTTRNHQIATAQTQSSLCCFPALVCVAPSRSMSSRHVLCWAGPTSTRQLSLPQHLRMRAMTCTCVSLSTMRPGSDSARGAMVNPALMSWADPAGEDPRRQQVSTTLSTASPCLSMRLPWVIDRNHVLLVVCTTYITFCWWSAPLIDSAQHCACFLAGSQVTVKTATVQHVATQPVTMSDGRMMLSCAPWPAACPQR